MGGIPLVILGGSDPRPADLPAAAAGQHALVGHKGADVRVGGRPLTAVLIDRMRACGAFEPIAVAGPARVWTAALPGERIIDTDATVGRNIRVAIEALERAGHRGPVAFTACDIVPDVGELSALLEDYRAQVPCDVWFPLIRVPDDVAALGASAWKPEYRIVIEESATPVDVLPSHLVIADPAALRQRFLQSLFDIAYRTRNRSIARRRASFVARVLGGLLLHDLGHLLTLRLPNLTWSVLRSGLLLAGKLRAGTIRRQELESAIGTIILKTRHRARFPGRGVRLPILDGLSLARDVDTEEEARALTGGAGS